MAWQCGGGNRSTVPHQGESCQRCDAAAVRRGCRGGTGEGVLWRESEGCAVAGKERVYVAEKARDHFTALPRQLARVDTRKGMRGGDEGWVHLRPPAGRGLPSAFCALPPASHAILPPYLRLPPLLPPCYGQLAFLLPPVSCLLPPVRCRLPAACLLPTASCFAHTAHYFAHHTCNVFRSSASTAASSSACG